MKDKSWLNLCGYSKLQLYPLLYSYKTIKTPKKNPDIKVIKSFTVSIIVQYYQRFILEYNCCNNE